MIVILLIAIYKLIWKTGYFLYFQDICEIFYLRENLQINTSKCNIWSLYEERMHWNLFERCNFNVVLRCHVAETLFVSIVLFGKGNDRWKNCAYYACHIHFQSHPPAFYHYIYLASFATHEAPLYAASSNHRLPIHRPSAEVFSSPHCSEMHSFIFSL
jgi:hypothetical protein